MALEPVDKPDHYCRLEVTSRVERQFCNNVLIVEKNGPNYDYMRLTDGDRAAKSTIVSGEPLQMGILPIAPVHVPAMYGSNMMLKFASPLVIHSHSAVDGFFKMPYEIGVVSFDNGDHRIIDAVSLGLPKYGLYGNPENGTVCRSYQTELSPDMPKAELHHEAIGKLKIRNETSRTHNLSKVVFPVEGVDFYFDENRVFFKDVEAKINEVSGKTILEAKVVDAQLNYNITGLAQNPHPSYTMELGF